MREIDQHRILSTIENSLAWGNLICALIPTGVATFYITRSLVSGQKQGDAAAKALILSLLAAYMFLKFYKAHAPRQQNLQQVGEFFVVRPYTSHQVQQIVNNRIEQNDPERPVPRPIIPHPLDTPMVQQVMTFLQHGFHRPHAN